jgi:glycosyltransferase involved in cell wall biosynthesis
MNISVIIPVYNAENFVQKAVESALLHSEVKEIILIEDGSTDESLQVCSTLAVIHDRVFLYQHHGGVNRGAGSSRNLGITKATQDYICFLDADDFMTETRFDVERELFQENTEIDGVYGAIGTKYYDDLGAIAWETQGYDETTMTTVSKRIDPNHLFDYLIYYKNPDNYQGHFSIDSLTLKRESLKIHKIQFEEELRLHQDTAFIWHCAYKLKLIPGQITSPVAVRGVHESNRFLNNKNPVISRALFYSTIRKWAKTNHLKTIYRWHFLRQYYNLPIKNQGIMTSVSRSIIGFTLNTCHSAWSLVNYLIRNSERHSSP